MTELASEEMTADQAREFVEHVRASVEDLKDWIIRAVKGRAWIALGYGSWDEMCEAEFDGAVIRLPREDRREAVASLREAGLSTRAIGSALGISNQTVGRDLSTAPNGAVEPQTVTSLDGRERPATRSTSPQGEVEDEAPPTPEPDVAPAPEPGIWYSGPAEVEQDEPEPADEHAEGDARRDAELDAAMEGTTQRFRANFARARLNAREITTFDVDRTCEVFAGNWEREVGDLVRRLREWCDAVEGSHRRQSSGLRVIGGSVR